MLNYQLTQHAKTRMPQRNLKKSDLDIVLTLGTEINDGVILTNNDASQAIRELKDEIKRVERLTNLFVVIENEALITAYRPRPSKMKKIMRRRRQN
jgi:hypothetical protein